LEYIYEYGLFLAQAVTLVAAILVVVAAIVSMGQKQRSEHHEGHIEIRNLNDKYRHISDTIEQVVSDPELLKAEKKSRKKADKAKAKEQKKQRKQAAGEQEEKRRPRLYVLDH
jgi:serine protease SohB